jgi:hypothetical protein
MQVNDFSEARALLMSRQKFSYLLAHLGRALAVCVCLGAWAMVVLAALSAAPVAVLSIVAVGATLVGVPLYTIASAQIQVQRRKRNRVVAHG